MGDATALPTRWQSQLFLCHDHTGNITSRKEYAYINPESTVSGTPTATYNYTYGDADWGDLLTAYNGISRTYDQIGNVLTDGTWTYTWQNGRELASMSKGSTTWNYTYDANGMRTSRSNGSKTYNYVYNGSQLTQMTVGNDTLYFTYGAMGPATVTWDGYTYYYVLNGQGDVTAILDVDGIPVVWYNWNNAWGYNPEPEGLFADTLGELNPLRYRSYVYDTETGYYYLQSRYYDPEIGRFINADAFPATGQGMLGNNMFAYCGNNPVSRSDTGGYFWETIWDIASLVTSVVEVVANPTDPWAWAGLVGDVIDVALPCVGGLGEAVDATKTTVRVVQGAENVVETARTFKRTAEAADDVRKATGAYVVLFEDGMKYVGKGGFGRAIKSATEHMSDVNKVSSIIWAPTSSESSAFVAEYLLQSVFGVGKSGNRTFNRIWSPGNNLFRVLQ